MPCSVSWTKVLPLARTIGISIALESPLPARELAQLVDRAHADNARRLLRTLATPSPWASTPPTKYTPLDQRILSVHIKDAVRELGALHLGQGLLDLPRLLGRPQKHPLHRQPHARDTPVTTSPLSAKTSPPSNNT